MKAKKVLALLLGIILVISLAACGNTENSGGNDAAAPAAQTEAAAPAAQNDAAPAAENDAAPAAENDAAPAGDEGGEAPAAASGDYNITWEDTAEIKILYPSMGPIPQGLQAVEDAMNEILEEELDIHVTLDMVEVGGYDQQVNLYVAANEKLDLMVTMPAGPASLSAMGTQNQLIDMTDLLPQYAPRMLADLGDLIKGTQINGRTYGVTTNKNFSGAENLNFRADVLEELGLTEKVQNMKTFTEYYEVLDAYLEKAQPGMAAVVPTDGHGAILPDCQQMCYVSDNFEDTVFLDSLGDNLCLVCAIGDDPTVYNTYRTEEFQANVKRVREMYQRGYVYKDSATTSEMGTSLMQSNVGFSFNNVAELGSEAAISVNCGTEMVTAHIKTKPIATSALVKFVWVMPVTCTEPEAAMTFLEMFYNDSRIANLFAWGIEGVDYEVDENGVAQFVNGQEGNYHTVAFLNVNNLIILPFGDDAPTLREDAKRYMAEATVSPFTGFAADTSAVTDEIGALSNVLSEYLPQIVSGLADEATYEEFLEKLDANGIEKVVALYQEQLNAWLATQ